MKVLGDPLPIDTDTWVLVGVLEEKTRMLPPQAGFARVMGAPMMVGMGVVSQEYERDDFDYLEFVAKYNAAYEGPEKFGGCSGGGLWHMPLAIEHGQTVVKDCVLSGVAFWQSQVVDDERKIRCHGRKSIYQRVINALSL